MKYSLPFEQRRNKIITRYESETNYNYGKNPENRTINELIAFGVINLDKPSGPTSHETADNVKKIFKAKTCGHGGTLDPRVTGVLPLGLNKATKLLQVFLLGGKEYVCEMKLHQAVPKKELNNAFKQFTGTIKQLPPIKSNVKRVLRDREVYYIKLLEFDKKTALFRTGCEAGTYIRKLCTDIGDYLKVKAHMQELRRTQASSFKEEDSITLYDLQEALTLYKERRDESLLRKCVLNPETAVSHMKKIYVSDGGVAAVSHGASLTLPGLVKLDNDIVKGDSVALLSLKNELVAIGEALMDSKTMAEESKGLSVKTMKVFMQADTYPRSWKKNV